ncbi:MAG: BamA/TamA family outer membrane protein, partial [Myxococcota bacterium]
MFPVFKFWVAALAASHVGLPAAGSALEAASAERSKPQANALDREPTAPRVAGRSELDFDDRYTTESFGIPVIAYTPETSAILGAAMIFSMENRAVQDPLQSFGNATAVYTLRNQWGAFVDGAFYFWRDRVLVETDLDVRRWREFYFGIGDDPARDGDTYDFDGFQLELAGLRRFLFKGLYGGLVLRASLARVTDTESPELPTLRGGEGSDMLGGGVQLVFDRRDRTLWTRRGVYVRANGVRFSDAVVSDFSVTEWSLDVRGFAPLGAGFVLGGQLRAEIRDGDVPFFRQAVIGGSDRLRGTFAGRFRDDTGVWAQSELRTPYFWWRLAAVAFAGAGLVGPSPRSLDGRETVFSGG